MQEILNFRCIVWKQTAIFAEKKCEELTAKASHNSSAKNSTSVDFVSTVGFHKSLTNESVKLGML